MRRAIYIIVFLVTILAARFVPIVTHGAVSVFEVLTVIGLVSFIAYVLTYKAGDHAGQ